MLTGFATYFLGATGKTCHFALIGEEAQTVALDLVRRGVERISVVTPGYESFGETHDSETCARCELNRDLLLSADTSRSLSRHKKVLSTMWHTFLHEEHSFAQSTPVSSTASTPRGLPPAHRVQSSEEAGESTGRHTHTARSTEFDTSNFSISDCVKLMWTEGLLEAEAHFDDFRLRECRYGLHYTEAAFLRTLLVGDSKSRAVALARLAETEEAAEADLRGHELWAGQILSARLNSTTKAQAVQLVKVGQRVRLAVVVYAETQMCRSGCHILHEAYIKGSLAFRTAWKQYQRCQRLGDAQRLLERTFLTPEEQTTLVNSQLEDDISSLLKFGIGVLTLSLSMAPQKVVRLAKLAVGMEADQTQGLKLLYECMRISGGIRVPLALMFVLFWLLIYIPDFISGKTDRYREAEDLIQLGRALLPKSAFFYWLESYLQEKQGQLSQALLLLEKATRVCRRLGFPQTPPRLAFEKGWLYFLCQNWPLSARHLEESLKDVEATSLPLLLLGVSCCMLGDGSAAEQCFHKLLTPEMERNYADRWISTRARRYLERKCYPLFPLEVVYLTDYLSCMGRDWHENALLFLEKVSLEVPKLPQIRSFFALSRPVDEESDEYVVYLLLKGAVCRHLGRLRDAQAALELAVRYHDSAQKETFAVPHAYYELGMVFAKGRDWEAAEQPLLRAKTFKRFDFRKSLLFKVDAALELVAAEQRVEARR